MMIMDFDQAIKTNKLLSQAVTEFNADIIVPLDADEFIVAQIEAEIQESI